ncbi:uncharacterized protein MYCFIDRAFT_200393 [Pseudocercospora fijiensis CIRAD86]|uniref:F-box domain-containing protein n=1 Tax=Pseudocercospora fijiensis (strain CIRAD86) TaxID=383855 RepID=M3A0X2_PSEFD|nr:uncharacterized protein MYCFIDRAFT_200393 [Pseudocercospora fijiensis CIRAD86]EME78051.1 hypothetical protein MYCFIDRAFT_200393 [Pseudocercospora fijiensis CIRAD86]
MSPTGGKPYLLKLPQELRDLIMEYIILKPENTITMLPNFNCHKNEISARPPSICSVNQQLRYENLPKFYSDNTFTAQLDNKEDLETAVTWLAALGDQNVRHLQTLSLCGWTRVPFGHMVSRRWLNVTLHLKKGVMDVRQMEADLAADDLYCRVNTTIEELKASFAKLVEARSGLPWDVRSVQEIMEGFNMLCTGY